MERVASLRKVGNSLPDALDVARYDGACVQLDFFSLSASLRGSSIKKKRQLPKLETHITQQAYGRCSL